MPKEVEIKFRVQDKAALERKLRRLGFRQITPETFECNVIYDLPGGDLRRRGELLRLRRYGDWWTLTHKARALGGGRHKVREEREVSVADGVTLAEILQALGFTPAFRYEKFRSEWSDGQGQVVVDRTPIGTYAELEGPSAWIDHRAQAIGIDGRDYITATYSQLFERWKRDNRSPARDMTFSLATASKRRTRR
jgi:adenylate cyclase class 2